jgi:hypothetical protein
LDQENGMKNEARLPGVDQVDLVAVEHFYVSETCRVYTISTFLHCLPVFFTEEGQIRSSFLILKNHSTPGEFDPWGFDPWGFDPWGVRPLFVRPLVDVIKIDPRTFDPWTFDPWSFDPWPWYRLFDKVSRYVSSTYILNKYVFTSKNMIGNFLEVLPSDGMGKELGKYFKSSMYPKFHFAVVFNSVYLLAKYTLSYVCMYIGRLL